MSISKMAKELIIKNNNSTKKDNYREAKRQFKLNHYHWHGELKKTKLNKFFTMVDRSVRSNSSSVCFFLRLTKGRVDRQIDFSRITIEEAKVILK